VRSQGRVLIVDDDDAIRVLLMTVLRRRGIQADAARNGVEALEKLAAQSYEVMLLDLMMPQKSGYDVLQEMADMPPPGGPPLVLVLTAGLEPRPLDTRLVIGMLHKPFDVELLVDTVTGCMTARNNARPSATATLPQQTEEAN
jgi:DNA-binding response OmpR family regulator